MIGNQALGLNNKFTFAVILVIYWSVTLLNIRFDMEKAGGKIGVWFGLYIPMAMMLILGICATVKTGLIPTSTLGRFGDADLIPDFTTENTIKFFALLCLYSQE